MTRYLLPLLPLCLSTTLSASPVRVVDYGADYGSGYYRNDTNAGQTAIQVDVDGDGDPSNDSLSFWEFSFTEPMNPSGILYDTEATSAIFYGGITAFFSEPGRYLVEGLLNENHERRDDWNMMTADPDKAPTRCYGFWFWKKEDFLNGGDQYTVSFAPGSKIVPHVSRYFSGLDDGRWVIQQGGQFYVSEKTFGDYLGEIGRAEFTHTSYILDPTTTNWAPYNPTEPYDIVFDIDAATYAPVTFNDVQAVGFYVYAHTLRPEEIGFKWHSFEVYAEVARPAAPSFHSDMVTVPSGSYQGETLPSFSIGRTEVPYTLWKEVYKWAVSNQYAFDLDPGYAFNKDGDMGSMDLGGSHQASEPATDMTWEDAVVWCNALSELEGLTPVYYAESGLTQPLRESQRRDYPANYNDEFDIYVDWTADGFRLPTALEWGYAAEAGGSFSTATTDAWIGSNSSGSTQPVGQLAANAFGLQDVAGNVWEFVWDVPNAGNHYDPATHNTRTVLGGGFRYPEDRSTTPLLPHGDEPWQGNPATGLRLMRSHGSTPPAVQTYGTIPTWNYDQGETILPGTPPAPNPTLIASQLSAKITGNYTYGQPGDADYEDDNIGFERDDEAFVRISPFYMGTTEITFAQWNEVYQWAKRNGYTFDHDGDLGSMDWQTGQHTHSPDEPVTDVGWNDVIIWCNALSEYEGLTPIYYSDEARTQVLRSANRYRNRMDMTPRGYNTDASEQLMSVYARWEHDGYRLPTAHEWEGAYRDTQISVNLVYPWGSNAADAVNYGWVSANAGDKTRAVGLKPANGYGLYDLTGNVTEWVWDWPGTDYYKAHNPKGGETSNTLFGKELRGGNFGSAPLRVTSFDEEREGCARAFFGFRVVRCEANEHPEDQTFVPETVIDLDIANFDQNEGQQFRYNNHRTGVTSASGIPSGQPSVNWQFDTGGDISASPIEVNGVVYIGSETGIFYALDAATGAEVWQFDAGAPIKCTAAVSDGKVFFGADDYLFCLDITDGSEVWRYTRGGSATDVTVSPAIAHGIVYTAFGRWTTSGYSGIDIATGQEVWRYRLGSANHGPMGPAIDGLTLYAPYQDNAVMSADLETEYSVWRTAGHRSQASMVIVDTDTVLYLQLHNLKALSRTDGSTQWSFDLGGSFDDKPQCSPAVGTVNLDGGGTATYAFVGSLYGDFFAVDTSNGQEVWHYYSGGTPETGMPIKSSPTLSNDRVYVGSDNGKLYCFDATDGTIVWEHDFGFAVSASPWVADGRVFIADASGTVTALSQGGATPTITAAPLPDGTIETSYSTPLGSSGGTAPFSWSVTSGSLPDGLSLGNDGIISGTPTVSGSFNFTVQLTDANTNTDDETFSIMIAPTALGAPGDITLAAQGNLNVLRWHDNATTETAYVIERRDITDGISPGNEVILDDNRANETGSGTVTKSNWWNQTWGSNYHGTSWAGKPAAAGGNATATYTPDLTGFNGTYEVFINYPGSTSNNLTPNQPITINHDGGSDVVVVDGNQNGGAWYSLGTYNLTHGTASVQFTNDYTPTSGTYTVADAVRFYMAPQQAPWEPIVSTLAPDSTQFIDGSVTAGRTYEYRIRVTDGSSDGNWSNLASITAQNGRARPSELAGGWNLHPQDYWSQANYFADKMLHASYWIDNWSQYDFPLNERGYLTSIPQGTMPATKITMFEPGQYTLRWQGTGDVTIASTTGSHVTFVSEDLSGPIKERIYEKVVPQETEALCRVFINSTDSLDPVTDIQVWAPGHAPAMGEEPDSLFHDSFLARMSAEVSILRFMDWGQTNHSTQATWSDRTQPDYYTQYEAMAWEHMVALCNELNVDMWICVPHLADDDYVQRLARLLRTGMDGNTQTGQPLNDDLKIYLEYSNELWNSQFDQYEYTVTQAEAYTGLLRTDPAFDWGEVDAWVGQRHAEVWDIFMTEFGAEWPNRVVRVVGTQRNSHNRLADHLVGIARVPGVEADAVAVASYWGRNLGAYAVTNLNYTSPTEQDYQQALTELHRMITEDLKSELDERAANAQAAGIDMIAYEGGQHIVGLYQDANNDGTLEINDPDLTNFLTTLNRRPEMYDLSVLAMDMWEQAGGKTFLAFNDVSPYINHGSWGYREFWYDDLSVAHKARAYENWLARQQISHIINGELGHGALGFDYTQTMQAHELAPPVSYAVTGGSLPEGVSLAANGQFSGTAMDYGNFSFEVTLTDNNADTDTRTYALRINPSQDPLAREVAADAWCANWQANPTGTLTYMLSGSDRISLLRWDLSDLAGKSLTQAELQLNLETGTLPATVTLHEVIENSWDENAVTWATRPTQGNLVASFEVTEHGVQTVDLINWLNSRKGQAEATLQVSSTTNLSWTSSDHTSNPAPVLIVNYLPEQVVPTTFDNWVIDNAEPALAIDGNHDGDNLPDLLEYAMGTNPLAPPSGAEPTISAPDASSFQFRFNPRLRDIRYIVEQSDDLITWDSIRFDSLTDAEALPDQWQDVQLSVPQQSKTFLRLRVEQTTP